MRLGDRSAADGSRSASRSALSPRPRRGVLVRTAFTALVTVVAFGWTQVVAAGVALGRVGPGDTPPGWSLAVPSLVAAGLVAATGAFVATRAAGTDSAAAARLAGLVPPWACLLAQVVTVAIGGRSAPTAAAAMSATLLAAGVVGVVLGTPRRPDALVVPTDPQTPDRLLIDEEPR